LFVTTCIEKHCNRPLKASCDENIRHCKIYSDFFLNIFQSPLSYVPPVTSISKRVKQFQKICRNPDAHKTSLILALCSFAIELQRLCTRA